LARIDVLGHGYAVDLSRDNGQSGVQRRPSTYIRRAAPAEYTL
jgi:hypothetical protein